MSDADGFAALPVRVIGDERPSALHLRVLACIASFDRRSALRGGRGCFANRSTLLEMIGCHPTNLSSAIQQLGRWGYIEQCRRGGGEGRTYRVRYNEDAPASEGAIPFKNLSSDKKPAAQANGRSAKTGGDPFADRQTRICRPVGATGSNRRGFSAQEKGRDSVETDSIDAAEAARLTARGAAGLQVDGEPDHSWLRRVEDQLQHAGCNTYDEWRSILASLEEKADEHEHGSGTRGMAMRLAAQVSFILETAESPPPRRARQC